jgi:hypothetical protein
MTKLEELAVPEQVVGATDSKEILRVWISNGQQYVSLRIGVWDDPAAWGILLADLISHVSNLYLEEKGFDRSKVAQRVVSALQAELASPTDVPEGKVT